MEEKSEMEAAQQLVQLSSGEEEDSVGAADNEAKSKQAEEGASSDKAEISARRGKRGAGKEESLEEQSRPTKRPRIRSLAELYAVTKPVSIYANGCHGPVMAEFTGRAP